ncbi:MAG: acyltransferase [Chitinophagaceae bacterium]
MHIASLNTGELHSGQKNRMDWVDSLRALAAIAVIMLHASADIVKQYGKISGDKWWSAHFYDSLTRFCVAIFFMLTGALLLNKTYPIREFLKKRASRIIWPFLFWSAVYLTYQLIMKYEYGKVITPKFIFDFSLIKMRVGVEYHLWYIYAITGIYLFIPIFSQWTSKSKINALHYFLMVWMVGIIASNHLLRNYSSQLDLSYFSGNLGYVVLGYYLSERLQYKKMIDWSFWIFILGVLITLLATYYFTLQQHVFYGGFYSYLTPNIIIASVGFFLMFRHQIKVGRLFQQVFRFIGKYSYGIYLSHVLVLAFLGKWGLNGMFVHPVIGIPITTLACLTLSTGITWLLSKLPGGKYFSGS